MMFFSRVSGFDISNLEKLPAGDRRKIELFSLWAFVSSVLCALSAAYLFKITTQSLIVATLSAITVFITFIAIQGLLNSNRGEHFGTLKNDEDESKLNRFNIFIYLLLTVLFSQPILIYVSHQIDKNKIANINHLESDLRLQALDEINNSNQLKIQLKLAQIRERINTLGGNLELYVPNNDSTIDSKNEEINKKIDLSLATRKALVIGNIKYDFGNVKYTIRSATLMKEQLEKMGFQVTFITDATRTVMEYQIDEFAKSLNPGDISFFWFNGHGGQEQKVAYFIPIDDKNGYVSINRIMESLAKRGVLVSIIMADACRSNPYGDFESGFNSSGITKNTFIGLPASAGQYSWEGVDGRVGFFTGHLLAHINENLDIQSIFDKVKEEVSNGNPQPPQPQNPTSISTLTSPITLSLQNIPKVIKEKKETLPTIDSRMIGQCELKDSTEITNISKDQQAFNCISEYLKIRDDLIQEIQLDENAHNKLKSKLEMKFADDQFNPIYYYKYIWSKQVIESSENDHQDDMKPMYRSVLITLIIWFILAGGFIYREKLSLALLSYRRFRNEEDAVSLYSHFQHYSLLTQESYSDFKELLKKYINSKSLLNESIQTNLPNPFGEGVETLERKNKYVRTGREAFENLNRALNS